MFLETDNLEEFIPKKNYLAIIPARSGSKRLPNKNILPLCGHPLISYTINAAKKLSKSIDHIFSTDDSKIREIAEAYGAYAPFLRPKELSGDNITNYFVMDHAIRYLKEKKSKIYDAYILLQPTSPFRTSSDILKAIFTYENGNLPTLASVKGPYQKRHKIIKEVSKNDKKALINIGSDNPFYIYNASIYITSSKHFYEKKSIHSTPESFYIMSEYIIDIDTKEDFEVASLICDKVNRNFINKDN